ncbi:LamG domain-containing protein [Oerskovia sp. M15]
MGSDGHAVRRGDLGHRDRRQGGAARRHRRQGLGAGLGRARRLDRDDAVRVDQARAPDDAVRGQEGRIGDDRRVRAGSLERGKAFLRLNQKSSGETFRANATSTYPSDGSTWVHLVGTYDGQRVRLYVDGVEQASIAGPASVGVNTLPLVVGAQPDGPYPFQGAVDDVGLYGRALSASEVAVLHASVETRPPRRSRGTSRRRP